MNLKSIGLVFALLCLPAYGDIMDFTTTGAVSCTGCAITGDGTGNVTVVWGSGGNTATITFAGAPSGTNVTSNGTLVSTDFGTLDASYTGTGATINGTFDLRINQTAPAISPLAGDFPSATLSGLIFSSSTAYADFGSLNPTITLGGGAVYELDTTRNPGNSSEYGIAIPPGRTLLAGSAGIPAAVPEPSSLTLLLSAAGSIALAITARRGRRTE